MAPAFDNTLVEDRKSRWARRAVAGTTALGLGAGFTIGGHFLFWGGTPGEDGAVVDLHEKNGMLLTDIDGKPAFLNYFRNSNPLRPLSMTVSLTTTDAMPAKMQDKLGQITKWRQEHVSRVVTPGEFRAVSPEAAAIIRGFYAEFEELTGIHVEVRENDPTADIAIGGYQRKEGESVIGFASFPQEVPWLTLLPQNQGFMMLDMDYINQKVAEGNPAAALALVAHEAGHNWGLLHPFDTLVDTGMTEKQQKAVTRMSYNNHTFPAIAQTSIDSGYGPLDIFLLRQALQVQGYPVPRLLDGDDTYRLQEVANATLAAATAKDGGIYQVPALSIVDNGGRNQLEGTAGDDLLVTESGYCGLLNRQEKQIALLKDGQPYCLVEGEFSVVRSGGGKDLILTAKGTEQQVFLASGTQEVVILDPRFGSKTIYAHAAEENPSVIDSVVDSAKGLVGADVDGATLTLHFSLFSQGFATASAVGDDIVLQFNAPSGRQVGQIVLKEQAKTGGQGIQRIRIIGNQAETLLETDVAEMRTADEWQSKVLQPMADKADDLGAQRIRADIARARQAISGDAGEWTAHSKSAETTTLESGGDMQPHESGGCLCGMRHDYLPARDATPASPKDIIVKMTPTAQAQASYYEGDFDGYLHRRRRQEKDTPAR